MKNTVKLTFVGDILCEMEQNQAVINDDQYDYADIFSQIEKYINKSDYVVGNLETPLAGIEKRYTNHKWSFNTPDEFALELKKVGFNFLSTANNHCLDRGVEGAYRTIDILDKYDIGHAGTYKNKEDRDKVFIYSFNQFKVAILSYTYGTNAAFNNNYLRKNERHVVNLFQPQEYILKRKDIFKRLDRKIFRSFFAKKKKKTYLEMLKKDITQAREKADFVIMCMHSGGQFNEKVDEYTKSIAEKMVEYGVDLVIGCHPHVVHNIEKKRIKDKQSLIAYSLGNFFSTPGTSSTPLDKMANYGIILNVYISTNKEHTIKKVTFSITKTIFIDKNKSLASKVVNLYDLIKQEDKEDIKDNLIRDNLRIYNTFLGMNKMNIDLKNEYDLELDLGEKNE